MSTREKILEIVCRGKHKQGGYACQITCGVQVERIMRLLESQLASAQALLAGAYRAAAEVAKRHYDKCGEFSHGGRFDCADAISNEIAALTPEAAKAELDKLKEDWMNAGALAAQNSLFSEKDVEKLLANARRDEAIKVMVEERKWMAEVLRMQFAIPTVIVNQVTERLADALELVATTDAPEKPAGERR